VTKVLPMRQVALGLASLIITFAAPTAALGQGQQKGTQKQPPSISEKTSEAFSKLRPLQETQNYKGMLDVLEKVEFKPNSYDEALILDMKAKIFAMTNQFSKAIAPWERSIELSDKHGYFSEKQTLDTVSLLAQLYGQEGSTSKVPAQQQQYFSKAINYFRRFLKGTNNPTHETMMAYASILYYRATADQNKIDQAILN